MHRSKVLRLRSFNLHLSIVYACSRCRVMGVPAVELEVLDRKVLIPGKCFGNES